MLNLAPFPICSICEKPVKIETSKVDEHGKAVHDGCYLLKVGSKKTATKPRPIQIRDSTVYVPQPIIISWFGVVVTAWVG
jgi:hypothetical protein